MSDSRQENKPSGQRKLTTTEILMLTANPVTVGAAAAHASKNLAGSLYRGAKSVVNRVWSKKEKQPSSASTTDSSKSAGEILMLAAHPLTVGAAIAHGGKSLYQGAKAAITKAWQKKEKQPAISSPTASSEPLRREDFVSTRRLSEGRDEKAPLIHPPKESIPDKPDKKAGTTAMPQSTPITLEGHTADQTPKSQPAHIPGSTTFSVPNKDSKKSTVEEIDPEIPCIIKFDEEIGRGASGTVSAGTYNGMPVAIKEFTGLSANEGAGELELREELKKLLYFSQTSPPYILKLVGAAKRTETVTEEGQQKEKPKWFVVTRLFGNSLYKELPKLTTMEERCDIARQISTGLAFMHAENIWHRDLKSLNIFINRENPHGPYQVAIGDLGLAVSQETQVESDVKATFGTRPWMAPELRQGKNKANAASDMFSFGGILYELYTGKIPYSDFPSKEEFNDALSKGLPPWKDKLLPLPNPKDKLAVTLYSLMKACCHPNPSARPSAKEVSDRLCQALGVESEIIEQSLPEKKTPKPRRRETAMAKIQGHKRSQLGGIVQSAGRKYKRTVFPKSEAEGQDTEKGQHSLNKGCLVPKKKLQIETPIVVRSFPAAWQIHMKERVEQIYKIGQLEQPYLAKVHNDSLKKRKPTYNGKKMERPARAELFMEQFPRGSLWHLLNQKGTVSFKELYPIIMDTLHGIAEFHNRGLAHGGVHIANVLLYDANGKTRAKTTNIPYVVPLNKGSSVTQPLPCQVDDKTFEELRAMVCTIQKPTQQKDFQGFGIILEKVIAYLDQRKQECPEGLKDLAIQLSDPAFCESKKRKNPKVNELIQTMESFDPARLQSIKKEEAMLSPAKVLLTLSPTIEPSMNFPTTTPEKKLLTLSPTNPQNMDFSTASEEMLTLSPTTKQSNMDFPEKDSKLRKVSLPDHERVVIKSKAQIPQSSSSVSFFAKSSSFKKPTESQDDLWNRRSFAARAR